MSVGRMDEAFMMIVNVELYKVKEKKLQKKLLTFYLPKYLAQVSNVGS